MTEGTLSGDFSPWDVFAKIAKTAGQNRYMYLFLNSVNLNDN